MSLYEELKWRGLIKDISDEKKVINQLDERKIKFYCGFDPTGESLTIGHLVQVVRSLLLQKYGHTPVILIGGATGLIGDPRQTSERKLLTLETSLKNADLIKKQITRFVDEKKVIFVNNNDWISKIDMISFLRDYGKHFSINYMLAKENVQARLESGISYTEFSYMIIQAIDFHHLYKNLNVTMQFGGSDQWGNITAGLELIRKLDGDKHDAVGLSSPLLLKSDGTKFGKSETGALWIDKELTSPYEIYQYFLNASDDDVIKYLKTLTLLDRKEIEDLEKSKSEKPELRESQKKLAKEITIFLHKEDEFLRAERVSSALFLGVFNTLTKNDFKVLEQTLDNITIKKSINIVDALIETKLATSKREAREFIQNGAVVINDTKVSSIEYNIDKSTSYHDKFLILRRGKKKYALIILN